MLKYLSKENKQMLLAMLFMSVCITILGYWIIAETKVLMAITVKPF